MLDLSELGLNALKHAAGEWLLIWDNRKGQRLNRRLELEHDTVGTVRTWRPVRDTLDLPTPKEPGHPLGAAGRRDSRPGVVSLEGSRSRKAGSTPSPAVLGR